MEKKRRNRDLPLKFSARGEEWRGFLLIKFPYVAKNLELCTFCQQDQKKTKALINLVRGEERISREQAEGGSAQLLRVMRKKKASKKKDEISSLLNKM